MSEKLKNPVPFNPHRVLTGSKIDRHLEMLRTIYANALDGHISDEDLGARVRQILTWEQPDD